MTRGAQLVFDHFAKFGLIMHIGRNGSKSKTEAIFFPPKLGTNQTQQSTSQIAVADGYITFTNNFKYLGTTIAADLREDTEIKLRISKAAQSMGALREFFKNEHVNLRTKHLIYLAIPVNILLWGCESWGCAKSHMKKVAAFHHKSIRSILGINMHQVQEDRIKNEQVRERFLNIRPIEDIIAERQLRWMGKLSRMDGHRMPKQLLTAWCNNPRPRGRPQQTIRHCLVSALQRILPDIPSSGRTAHWTHLAEDPKIWSELMASAGLRQQCVSR